MTESAQSQVGYPYPSLRAERAALLAHQYRIAAAINSHYPRPANEERSPYEVATERSLGEQAEANAARIREIDAELGATDGT